jgi:N-acetylmuramoyl-L-alanine amidase
MTTLSSVSDKGVYYQVKQGDNLDLIALRFGFKDHTAIYNHPANADFKAQRPDPDILFPGDRVFIPKRIKEQPCATDQRSTFVLERPRKVLRLTIEDSQGNAIANAPYQLILERTDRVMGRLPATQLQTFEGNTGEDGLIEQPVPLNARRGKLIIGSFVRELAIGDLNPPAETEDNGISGIQARLANLGFGPGPVNGAGGPRTEAAIQAFQAEHPSLPADGVCGPETLAKLKAEHGS